MYKIIFEKSYITSWYDSNATASFSRRLHHGVSNRCILDGMSSARALQMNDRGIAEKQTIAGKFFNFALASRHRLAIWPKPASMSKLFIANYRDERLFMCKWAIKGECNPSSRCATIVKPQTVASTRRERREKIKARWLRLYSQSYLRSWDIARKSLFSVSPLANNDTEKDLAERSIYRRLKLYTELFRVQANE